jgi:hypothetical protein
MHIEKLCQCLFLERKALPKEDRKLSFTKKVLSKKQFLFSFSTGFLFLQKRKSVWRE